MSDGLAIYKVVTMPDTAREGWWEHPFLVSAIVFGQAEVQYRPEEWAEAPAWLRAAGLHLTAFENWRGVREFLVPYAYMGKPVLVFKGKAEDVLASLPSPLYTHDLVLGDMIPMKSCKWPYGTVMARRLLLEQCVQSSLDVPELGIVKMRR